MLRACSKREIKIIANQHKEIELYFVGNVKFLYAEGVFIKKRRQRCIFLAAISQPQNRAFQFRFKMNGKNQPKLGGFASF